MSWKGMITEDHRCQGHEIGLLPSIGDGEPAEVLSIGQVNFSRLHFPVCKIREITSQGF